MKLKYRIHRQTGLIDARFKDNAYPKITLKRIDSIDDINRFNCIIELGEVMAISNLMLSASKDRSKAIQYGVEDSLRYTLPLHLRQIVSELEKAELNRLE